ETDTAPRTTPHEREVVLTVIWEYRSYTLEGSTERAPDWNRQRDDVWIRVAQTVGKKLAMKDYTVSRCKTIRQENENLGHVELPIQSTNRRWCGSSCRGSYR
ncbi:hypothetical protein PFISCL1PPCAC_4657, partial [Pristionchus fissidentatus]